MGDPPSPRVRRAKEKPSLLQSSTRQRNSDIARVVRATAGLLPRFCPLVDRPARLCLAHAFLLQQVHKRSEIRVSVSATEIAVSSSSRHNETLFVAAIRVRNPDRLHL